MRSGSSERNEKPRPADNWNWLHPRSKSALSRCKIPCFPKYDSTFLKLPSMRMTFAFAPFSASSARAIAAASASMPISVPFGPRRCAISFACPAPPSVASRTTSSGWMSNCSKLSCKRTVRCPSCPVTRGACVGAMSDIGSLEDR